MEEEGRRNLDKMKDIGEMEDRILVVAERNDGGRDLWWVKRKLMVGLVGNGNIHFSINFDYENIEKAKHISTGRVSAQQKTST